MKNLSKAMDRFREVAEEHDPTADTVYLHPDVYDEYRRFFDLQPARVKDSRGAHYEKA